MAQIWLDGDETLVNTVDREGNVQAINMVQGQSLTHDPLVVLVSTHSLHISFQKKLSADLTMWSLLLF